MSDILQRNQLGSLLLWTYAQLVLVSGAPTISDCPQSPRPALRFPFGTLEGRDSKTQLAIVCPCRTVQHVIGSVAMRD